MCAAPPEEFPLTSDGESAVSPAIGFENAKREREIALAPSLTERQREIALTAIAIADESGIEAVSMRNIAERLGMGTMTIYSYLENKDDLIALMADELTAEFLIPEPMPTEWREAVRQIAVHTHETIKRHPWMFSAPGHEFDLRPNVMRHVDQSIRAVAGLDMDPLERMSMLRLVDDYVLGHAQGAARRFVRSDPKQEERKVSERLRTAKQAEIKRMFDQGELPALAGYFGNDAELAMQRISQGPPEDPRAFERGLEVVLDGIAAMIERG
jgi:AcrR family transcriptional regulator